MVVWRRYSSFSHDGQAHFLNKDWTADKKFSLARYCVDAVGQRPIRSTNLTTSMHSLFGLQPGYVTWSIYFFVSYEQKYCTLRSEILHLQKDCSCNKPFPLNMTKKACHISKCSTFINKNYHEN